MVATCNRRQPQSVVLDCDYSTLVEGDYGDFEIVKPFICGHGRGKGRQNMQ